MSVTLKDIATRTGLSVPAVSLILNNKGERYSEPSRKAVRDVAAKLRYVPNSTGLAMRKQCFDCVGLLQSTQKHQSYLPDELFDGIADTLEKLDMHLSVLKLSEKQMEPGKEPKFLRRHFVDGLLVNFNYNIPEELSRMIQEYSRPSVWMNIKLENNAIWFDEVGAIRETTRHLIQMGHRNIAYLDYSYGTEQAETELHYSVRDRLMGYSQAMSEASLKIHNIIDKHSIPRDERLRHAKNLLSSVEKPTAIIGNSFATIGPVCAAAWQLGLNIPRDLSIVSFVDSTKGSLLGTPIASIELPMYSLGELGIEMLIRQIKHGTKREASVVVPCRLHLEGSIGPSC